MTSWWSSSSRCINRSDYVYNHHLCRLTPDMSLLRRCCYCIHVTLYLNSSPASHTFLCHISLYIIPSNYFHVKTVQQKSALCFFLCSFCAKARSSWSKTHSVLSMENIFNHSSNRNMLISESNHNEEKQK